VLFKPHVTCASCVLVCAVLCCAVCRCVQAPRAEPAAGRAAAWAAGLQQDNAGARSSNGQQGNVHPTLLRTGVFVASAQQRTHAKHPHALSTGVPVAAAFRHTNSPGNPV
jgi:hypothetical protein